MRAHILPARFSLAIRPPHGPPGFFHGSTRVGLRGHSIPGAMYIAIRQYPILRESVDEIVSRTRDGFLSIVRGTPGFVAYHVMDPGDGTVVTVSVFETREGIDESTRRAARWVQENLGEMVTGPPMIITGPVRLDGSGAW